MDDELDDKPFTSHNTSSPLALCSLLQISASEIDQVIIVRTREHFDKKAKYSFTNWFMCTNKYLRK